MRLPVSSVVLGLALTGGAQAVTLTPFSDLAAFQTAAGTLTGTETFNDVVGEPSFNGADLTLGDLTLRNDTDAGRGVIDQPPLSFGQFDIDGTAIASLLTTNGQIVTLTWSTPITAFGAFFASARTSVVQNTRLLVQGEPVLFQLLGGNDKQFVGFVSDTPVSSFSIVSDDNDGFGMDNLSWKVAPVPLPPALLLLGGALAAAASLRLRRRQG